MVREAVFEWQSLSIRYSLCMMRNGVVEVWEPIARKKMMPARADSKVLTSGGAGS